LSRPTRRAEQVDRPDEQLVDLDMAISIKARGSLRGDDEVLR
jgi:hypothetical protein